VTALLDVDHVSAGYGDVEIVHELSIHVDAGEVVTIIGPNGCGKSTLLKAIFGMLSPTHGAIRLGGADVTHYSAPQMVAAGASFVPQTDNVFPSLTVRENLEMGGYRRDGGVAERALEVLALFPELERRPREQASKLSGGQRQALAIARALMLEPRLLILDEPTASLSPIMRREIFDRIRTIRHGGVAVLMVEQNAREALAISDRGCVLVAGRNTLEQSGAELLANPDIGRLFLGQEPAPGEEEGSSGVESVSTKP
jgi:ABC-type branched-subunit amino acid transport system ATPase component